MENDSTLEREYGAFNKIKDNSPKFVISLDIRPFKKHNSRFGSNYLTAFLFIIIYAILFNK